MLHAFCSKQKGMVTTPGGTKANSDGIDMKSDIDDFTENTEKTQKTNTAPEKEPHCHQSSMNEKVGGKQKKQFYKTSQKVKSSKNDETSVHEEIDIVDNLKQECYEQEPTSAIDNSILSNKAKGQILGNMEKQIESVQEIKCDNFTVKVSWQKPIASVHEGKIFKCNHCSSCFKVEAHMKMHISSAHNEKASNAAFFI